METRSLAYQEQIARAVELGLGVSSPSQIELKAAGSENSDYCRRVTKMLSQG